jgi:hypothetical protein
MLLPGMLAAEFQITDVYPAIAAQKIKSQG